MTAAPEPVVAYAGPSFGLTAPVTGRMVHDAASRSTW
jgi:hypothetical protein